MMLPAFLVLFLSGAVVSVYDKDTNSSALLLRGGRVRHLLQATDGRPNEGGEEKSSPSAIPSNLITPTSYTTVSGSYNYNSNGNYYPTSQVGAAATEMRFTIDLAPYASAIDDRMQTISFQGTIYINSYTDCTGRYIVEYVDVDGILLEEYDSGKTFSNGYGDDSYLREDSRVLPVGTRRAVVRLLSDTEASADYTDRVRYYGLSFVADLAPTALPTVAPVVHTTALPTFAPTPSPYTPEPTFTPAPTPTPPTPVPTLPPPTAVPSSTSPSTYSPTTATPTYSREGINPALVCTQRSDHIETHCRNSNPTDMDCAPGLESTFLRGFDIVSWSERGRVGDAGLDGHFTLNGKVYRAPALDEVQMDSKYIIAESESSSSNIFSSVIQYQNSLSADVGLSSITDAVLLRGVAKSNMMQKVLGGTALGYEFTKTISKSLEIKNYVFNHVTSVTKAAYSVVENHLSGMACTSSYSDAVANLPSTYTYENGYESFIRNYGTHVVTGTAIGGTLGKSQSMSSCTVSENGNTDHDAYLAYERLLVDFTIHSSDSSTDFYGETISRSNMAICGGNALAYLSATPSADGPFIDWAASLLNGNLFPYCKTDVSLIPIYATIGNPNIRANVERAVVDYLDKAIKNSKLSQTQASCDTPQYSDQGSRIDHGAHRVIAATVGFMLTIAYLL